MYSAVKNKVSYGVKKSQYKLTVLENMQYNFPKNILLVRDWRGVINDWKSSPPATLPAPGDTRHNSCKGAKTGGERSTLLWCQLCASDSTFADDTYDYIFRSCQHPLGTTARPESDQLLNSLPLTKNLKRRLLPGLL